MDIFKNFAADTSKEESGAEMEIGDGAFITVARAGNKAYTRQLTAAFEASKYVLDQKNAESEARATQIMVDVMARTILLGWRGLEFQGEPIVYSEENAKKLLRIKDFRNLVSRFSDDFGKFKLATTEADEKNSSPTPSGSEPGVVN